MSKSTRYFAQVLCLTVPVVQAWGQFDDALLKCNCNKTDLQKCNFSSFSQSSEGRWLLN